MGTVTNTITTKLIIALVCAQLFMGALIFDSDNLPLGYELAKSTYIQFMGVIILIVGLSGIAWHWLKHKPLLSWRFAVLWGLIASWVISTYNAIDPDIALLGNPYRLQGLVYWLLLLAVGLVVYYYKNNELITGVIITIYTNGVAHALFALVQIVQLWQHDPNLITQGFYVNGFYGQSNFFGGKLSLCIIINLWLLWRLYKTKKLNPVIGFILGSTLSLFLLGLIASFSYGSWLGLITVIATLVLYKGYQRYGKIVIGAVAVLISLMAIAGAIALAQSDLRGQLWWESVHVLPNSPWWGFGFDNLHLVFGKLGKLLGLVVDRAHNLGLEILTSTGIVGTILLVLLLFPSLKIQEWNQIWVKFNRNPFHILLTILVINALVRMQIHTASAAGLLELTILLALWLAGWRAQRTSANNATDE